MSASSWRKPSPARFVGNCSSTRATAPSASKFQSERAAANGSYLAQDLSGVGDEAFCTGVGITGSEGALVRKGDTVVYVSLVDTAFLSGALPTQNDQGVVYTTEGCRLAVQIAQAVLH